MANFQKPKIKVGCQDRMRALICAYNKAWRSQNLLGQCADKLLLGHVEHGAMQQVMVGHHYKYYQRGCGFGFLDFWARMIHHPAVVSKHGHQLSATMASYSLGNPSDVFLFQITFHFLLGFLDHIGGLPSGEKEAFLNCRSCLKDCISSSLFPFVCESRTK